MSATDDRDVLDAGAAKVTLADLFERSERRQDLRLRVAAPARVATYNATTQRADLVLELLPIVTEAGGLEVPREPVPLPQVPVAWPRTAAGYLTLPLAPGDTGLVVFADRGMSKWLREGAPGDPVLGRAHDLADGVFYPGLHADVAPIVPPTSQVAAVLEGPQINLGVGAAQAVALAEALHAYLTGLFAVGVVVPTDGGEALQLAWQAYLLANPFTAFAATKVNAE